MRIHSSIYVLTCLISFASTIYISVLLQGLSSADEFYFYLHFFNFGVADHLKFTQFGQYLPGWRWMQNPEFSAQDLNFKIAIGFSIFFAGYLPFMLYYFFGSGKVSESERIVRGTRIVYAKDLNKLTKKTPSRLSIAGVKFPQRLETQNILFVGSPGSGKTSGIIELVEQIRQFNHKAIIVDPGGELIQRFARKGDILLNPYDSRTKKWGLFTEIKSRFDIERITKQIIPDGTGNSEDWIGYAQIFFRHCLEKLIENHAHNIVDLIHILEKADRNYLTKFFSDTSAARYFEKGSEGILGSTLTILNKYALMLQKLNPEGDFSIRDWVKSKEKNCLFITYRADQLESLKELISTWISVAGNEILTLEPDLERRIWLVCDEFPRLGKIQNITEILTNGRKNGLSAIFGMQSTSQLISLYGKENAEIILSCFNTSLILKNSDFATSEAMSKLIGQREVERVTLNQTSNGQKSTSTTRTVAQAVLPSQIENLQFNTGYLKINNGFPVAKIQFPIPEKIKPVTQAFVENEDFNLKKVNQQIHSKPNPDEEEPTNDEAPQTSFNLFRRD